MADKILAKLPEPLVQGLLLGRIAPGRLVALSGADHKALARDDIKNNWMLILPLAQAYPEHVPSAFLIADILQLLDAKLCLCLLGGTTPLEKHDHAVGDAKRLRMCLSKIRSMLRASSYSNSSHSPEIAAIKMALKRKASGDLIGEELSPTSSALPSPTKGLLEAVCISGSCSSSSRRSNSSSTSTSTSRSSCNSNTPPGATPAAVTADLLLLPLPSSTTTTIATGYYCY